MITGEEATDADFKKYFKTLRKTNLYFDSLSGYLNTANTTKMSKLALSFLNSEVDLLRTENEFRKMWLDADRISDIKINTEIPKIDFDYSNTFNFIKSVLYYKPRIQNVLNGGETRSYCYPLLRIIAANAPLYPIPYQKLLSILNDMDRPCLIWDIYDLIQRQHPQIISYLLINNNLAPLAFDLISMIIFDGKLLSGDIEREKWKKKRCELKNQLWIEMFDFVLNSFISDSLEKSETIAKILLELSQKVFNYNQSGDVINIINHNAYRELYDTALKRLSEYRIKNPYFHSSQKIPQRIIVTSNSHITNYLITELEKDLPTL